MASVTFKSENDVQICNLTTVNIEPFIDTSVAN